MTHRDIKVPGGDHGSVIGISVLDIFKFFAAHSKTGLQ